jgi:tRNA A37 threonylcarbamoyltransferase TsaD
MDELMDELLYNNTKELERCIKKAMDKGYDPAKNPISIQCLAEKQLTASFTAITNAIDNKISRLKDNDNSFAKKNGESLIEKAFNKT